MFAYKFQSIFNNSKWFVILST